MMKYSLYAVLLVFAACGSSWAQSTSNWGPPHSAGDQWAQPVPANTHWQQPPMGTPAGVEPVSPAGCRGDHRAASSRPGSFASRLFAGQEYLLIRTHFSEALAFARVNDSLSGGVPNRDVRAEELDFDYESSFRSILGFHWNDCTDVRFTYWHLDVDTEVTGVAGPGETIVDPYGGYATTGQNIAADAAVRMNVYDLQIARPLAFRRPYLGLDYAAGLRFADVEQFSASTIRDSGTTVSKGEFETDFFGVGPYFTLAGELSPPRHDRFSLLSKAGMALLVGQYDVSTQMTYPGVVSGGQRADRTRMVPVAEAELGGQYRATDYLTFSAGWLFQGWWNIGASGGTFDGEQPPVSTDAAFVGTDDSDIMSFDGLFVRGELEF